MIYQEYSNRNYLYIKVKMMKDIFGYLYVKHIGSCWEKFGEKWPDVKIMWKMIALIGSTTYLTLEFYHENAKYVLDDLIKLLKQSKYTAFIKVLQRYPYGARLAVSRKLTGVLRAVYSTNSLILGDCVVKKGIELYPILIPKYSVIRKLEKLVKDLSPIETDAWIKLAQPEDIFKEFRVQQLLYRLTPSEKKVLATAYELGYFEWPRIHSSIEVAKYLNTTNTTFLEHLRRAEKKIIAALYNYLS